MERCQKCGGEFTPLELGKHGASCSGVAKKIRKQKSRVEFSYPGGMQYAAMEIDWRGHYEDEVWRIANSDSVAEIEELPERREKREQRRLLRLYGMPKQPQA